MWARKRIRGETALAVADALVREGDVVVDVGADWGFYTVRLAELVGPAGCVHAFEPNPRTRANLDALVAAERHVVVHPIALSDQVTTAELHVPVEDGLLLCALGSLSPHHGVPCQTVAVETATLDESLGRHAGRVAFIKCDVEGHELAVLRGAATTLTSARPTLLVEIEHRHAGERMSQTFDYLADVGYSAWALAPAGILPIEQFDLERDQLAYLGGGLQADMPPDYVHDFLFTPPGQDRPSVASSRATHPRAASQE